MSVLETTADASVEQSPLDLVEVGAYRTVTEGNDHGLVVLAMRQPYWLVPGGDHFRLLVEPPAAVAAQEQLARFDRESVGWPPQPAERLVAARETEIFTPLVWCFTVLAVFRGQVEWPAWTDGGALDAKAVFHDHEWWRIATALFLHADAGHAISNVLSGLFVFSALVTTLGVRRGWPLLALASVAGNLAAAAINYPGPYRSIGASTAIFAGLGLLTGRAIGLALKSGHPRRWRAVFVPFAAGITILALYGAGGLNIDVGAHVTGFSAGLILESLISARISKP